MDYNGVLYDEGNYHDEYYDEGGMGFAGDAGTPYSLEMHIRDETTKKVIGRITKNAMIKMGYSYPISHSQIISLKEKSSLSL